MKLKKKWIITIPLLIVILLFLGLYYYYYSEDGNALTTTDKKWIGEQKNKIIDFYLPDDYPIYGQSGVFRAFINSFSEDTGLEFNIVPYDKGEKITNKEYKFKILDNKEKLGKNDLLLQEDVYVVYGKTKELVDSLNQLDGKTVGVLTEDSDEMVYYLKSYPNIKLKIYEKIDQMLSDYENSKIDFIIICHNMYLDKTINNEKYNIKHVFTEVTSKIVFSLNENKDMSKMNEIFTKYYNNWKKNDYLKVYNDSILEFYFKNYDDINDKTKTEFLTKTYSYGYVENKPYETVKKDVLYGIAGEYINRFLRLSNSLSINYKEYKNVDELKQAIEKKEVDIYFNYFNFEHQDYKSTNSIFIEKYVVLGNTKDNYVINSFESMKGLKVSILNNNAIYNFFKDNSKAILVPVGNLNDLLKKSDNNLIVLDKEVYSFYKNSKLKNYDLLFESTITNDYNFMISNSDDNKIFYDVFNYIISTNSYFNYRNRGLNSLNISIWESSSFENLYLILLVITLGPLFTAMIAYIIYKNRKKTKLIRKDEKRKYIDMLTSLKNRNYLNYNIKLWNESKKFPQSIIIVDLNNVKYVNDNYGHSEGDKLIVEAASMLINAQLENTEIIRTDGNEFLIYLVGYSEEQISKYAKNLFKEFKALPYQFGAAIGYSMIQDEIKSIDDAINEAVLNMKKNKEENR